MFGLVAATAEWTPKLGLDLQGGTRIQLQAQTEDGSAPEGEALAEARDIIDQRVNGVGVAESEVSTQGDRNIVVEIPGETPDDLPETISRAAQLYFRLVADVPAQYFVPPGAELPSEDPSDLPDEEQGEEQDEPRNRDRGGNQDEDQDDEQPQGRAVSGGLLAADELNPTPTDEPETEPTQEPEPEPGPGDDPDRGGRGADGPPPSDYLAWQANPPVEWLERFQTHVCPEGGDTLGIVDRPEEPLIACDEAGQKYLLTAAAIEGRQLNDAAFGTPQGGFGWVVTLDFNSEASRVFAEVTGAINQAFNSNGSQKAFAIVLDGEVLSTPTVSNGAIAGGSAEISGDFTQDEAASLANRLKYGALPLSFTIAETSVEGPTLAGDQLSAGLLAGALGLGLVMIFCMAYYKGLGLVVIASLAIAAAITYAAILLLAEATGFALTLPGIAGLIVGVGITADSFIVYFERIRDEMRDGKSMRVAVEAGWVRARATCLAGDAVSLLAGIVLFIFAIGVIKGFAFALILSTVIDLAVFFLFTKPMVSWLARFHFFNSGHKFSGLSAEAVGIERIGVVGAAGGRV